MTRRKHAADFARFIDWLEASGMPLTTESLDFATLADYVADLRVRPKVTGVWRGGPDALARSSASGPSRPCRPTASTPMSDLSARLPSGSSMRDCWRSTHSDGPAGGPRSIRYCQLRRHRPRVRPSMTYGHSKRGCAGKRPLDLRDGAIVSILVTSAARNSSVRLLRIEDIDFERAVIRFRRAKGAKTLEVALHAGQGRHCSATRARTSRLPSFGIRLGEAIRAGSSSRTPAGRHGH